MNIAREALRKLGIALALSLILAAVVTLSTPQTAEAACGVNRYYYKDPGHTLLVGALLCDCECACFSWGLTTENVSYQYLPCVNF